jgi:hypothetical protein
MELFTILEKFGFPAVYVGILFYLIRMIDKTNTEREVRFGSERERWQARDSEWMGKVLAALQSNSDAMIKTGSLIETMQERMAELMGLYHSNDSQLHAILEQFQRIDETITFLSQVTDKLMLEVVEFRHTPPVKKA